MEALIFLLVLIPVALLVLMIVLMGKIGALNKELRSTNEQLAKWMRQEPPTPPSEAEPVPDIPEERTPEPPPIITPPPVVEPITPTVEEETRERMHELFPEQAPSAPEEDIPGPLHAAARAPIAVEAPALHPPPPPRPSFFERHPDLEKFIGENLMNKIGITVLVIGIGLLLQYAIGKGWISETGRTLIGLSAGGILVFLAHRSRTNFRAFSSVLVAGGISVFYFTIAIAYHQYHLIGQVPAFAIMVVITALAVLLTLAYDRKELAVIALLGGFATPFMVSSGEGNFRVLFTYLLILNVGMLVLSNYKKWHVINVLSFGLTLLVFGAWALMDYPGMDPRPSLLGFAFATAFFLVFFGMNLRYNLRHKQAFEALDHMLLLLNTAAYYGVGILLLSDLEVKVTGLFTVLIGLFYLVFALYFHRKEGIPRSLKLLLIGLVLTFISLAAPVQLDGNHITVFWAVEAVLLLWFGQRSDLRLVQRGSFVVLALMLVSLWMDLSGIYAGYRNAYMPPLLNRGWITGMVAAIALGAMTVLLRRRDPEEDLLFGIRAGVLMPATAIAGVVVLYVTNFLEQDYQLGRALDHAVVEMALMAYTLLFVLLLELATQRLAKLYRLAIAALLAICGVLYITTFYASSSYALLVVRSGNEGVHFTPFHYIAFALMVIAVIRSVVLARSWMDRTANGWTIYLWSICTFLVILASQELDHALLLGSSTELSNSDTLRAARRVGYPILWGVGSFLFMWYGMRRRLRMVRVIALCLFAITLIKLFLFDLGALSEGGRVAAFIFLGALLLVISFMYQKLKGLLLEDGPKTRPDDAPAE